MESQMLLQMPGVLEIVSWRAESVGRECVGVEREASKGEGSSWCTYMHTRMHAHTQTPYLPSPVHTNNADMLTAFGGRHISLPSEEPPGINCHRQQSRWTHSVYKGYSASRSLEIHVTSLIHETFAECLLCARTEVTNVCYLHIAHRKPQ